MAALGLALGKQTNKMFIQATPFSGWNIQKTGEAASHGRWEWYFGCFSLNSLWFIEQLGDRQLKRNFMNVCVTEQVGPRLYLEKWVHIILEGQVAPRSKWYWERGKGGREEEWGGRGRWGEGRYENLQISSFETHVWFPPSAASRKRYGERIMQSLKMFLRRLSFFLLPLPFIYERPVGPLICKAPSSWIPGRHLPQ